MLIVNGKSGWSFGHPIRFDFSSYGFSAGCGAGAVVDPDLFWKS